MYFVLEEVNLIPAGSINLCYLEYHLHVKFVSNLNLTLD